MAQVTYDAIKKFPRYASHEFFIKLGTQKPIANNKNLDIYIYIYNIQKIKPKLIIFIYCLKVDSY